MKQSSGTMTSYDLLIIRRDSLNSRIKKSQDDLRETLIAIQAIELDRKQNG